MEIATIVDMLRDLLEVENRGENRWTPDTFSYEGLILKDGTIFEQVREVHEGVCVEMHDGSEFVFEIKRQTWLESGRSRQEMERLQALCERHEPCVNTK